MTGYNMHRYIMLILYIEYALQYQVGTYYIEGIYKQRVEISDRRPKSFVFRPRRLNYEYIIAFVIRKCNNTMPPRIVLMIYCAFTIKVEKQRRLAVGQRVGNIMRGYLKILFNYQTCYNNNILYNSEPWVAVKWACRLPVWYIRYSIIIYR